MPPLSELDTRYRLFLASLEARGLDGFLVSKPVHLRYLFNLDASAGFAITFDGESSLIVDSRYIQQATTRAANCKVEPAAPGLTQAVESQLASRRGRLGIESDHLSDAIASRIRDSARHLQVMGQSELIEQLRQIKSPSELETLRSAFRTALSVHQAVMEQVSIWEFTESELAARLDFEMRLAGAERPSFETMVLSGARSSHPHSRPSSHPIDTRSPLLIDFGAVVDGYHSDNTRMHLPAGLSRPQILEIAEESQARALDAVRPGVRASQVDAIARRVISDKGFGDCFGHGLGHGLGLEIHELPRVNATSETILEEGMVFTIEPGIYLPGEFGVRVEEAVVVTSDGCEVLPGGEVSEPTR